MAKDMTEAQMVNLVRNSLLVAGHEMGETGDHWPAIKATIHDIAQDYERVQIERNVFEEVRKNFLVMLKELETLYAQSPAEVKAQVRAAIGDFQEIYDATFSAATPDYAHLNYDDMPQHIKRADTIVKTLEDSDA